MRRLRPPFAPHQLWCMKRAVPPPSKNKTPEKCFHSSEGPDPAGRCRPTALPPFNRSKVALSVCWTGPHVLLGSCPSPNSAFNALLRENTQRITSSRDSTKTGIFEAGGGQDTPPACRTGERRGGVPSAGPAPPFSPEQHAPPQKKFARSPPGKDVARSSVRPRGTPLHTSWKAAATPPLASRWSVLPAALSVTVWLALRRSPSPASFPRHLFHTPWLPPSSLALPSYLAPGSRPYPKVLTQVLAAGRVRISLLLLWQVQGCL